MIPTLPIEVTCPQCKTKYMAQVRSIVDIGQEPELKAALLRGQLNAVVCPSCRAFGAVTTPLLYHDPGKELLLLFVPPQLNLPPQERERLTGSLINALMSAVPSEQRKGYFFNPRTVLTMDGLMEEVLQSDGVTKEMLEEQRARSALLQELVSVQDDEGKLQALIEQHKDKIDYSFLLALSAIADAGAAQGQPSLSERLLKLRDTLVQRLSIALPEPLAQDTSPAQVVDKVLTLKDEQARWALVVYNRPLFDYAFFQELTKRIEQAPAEEAESLRQVRAELLEMIGQLDQEAQAFQDAKVKLLQDALASQDPAQVLRDNRQEVDMVFLTVLSATLRQAQGNGDQDKVQKLVALNDSVLSLLQEDMPPELRFVNELLGVEYPEGTGRLMQERRADWDDKLLEILDTLAADLDTQKRTKTAQRLRDIRKQAEAMLQSSAG